MASLDELAKDQKTVADFIAKIEINYKKDSEVRKTEEYILARLTNLESYWKDFSQRNTEIQQHYEENKNHPYFAKEYFKQVENCYQSTKKLLVEKLATITQAKGKPSSESISQAKTTTETTMAQSLQEECQTRSTNQGEATTISSQSQRLKKQDALISAIDRIINAIYQEANVVHSIAYYQHKIKTLHDYWNNISKTHEEIMSFVTEADNNTNYIRNNQYALIEDSYQNAVIQMQEKLDLLSLSHRTTVLPSENTVYTHPEPPKIKLPQLTIPTFNGDYSNWRSFYDLFTQLIHENSNLGKAQKMFYLKSNLIGEPKHLLQNLQVSDSNYDTAWDLLKNRYNNIRLLVSSHLQHMLSQPPLMSESAASIKRLHDTTKENILAIKNLGVDTNNWDAIIIYIMTQKLDKESHKLYEQSLKKPREIQSLEELLKFLENRFQNLEAIHKKEHQSISFNKNPQTKTQFEKMKIKNYHNTTNERCPICTENHLIYYCAKFLSMEPRQRLDAVRRTKLCVNCLKAPHGSSQCQTSKTCRVCQKKHNTLLHITSAVKNDSQSQRKTSNSSAAEQNRHGLNCYALTEELTQRKEVQSNFAEQSDYSVLLATAIIKVKLSNGTTEYLRALIDQGSQASFISEDAVQRLRLPKERANIMVAGLGTNKVGTVRHAAKIRIQPRYPSNFETTITALVLSKLTKFLPTEYTTNQSWDHTQQLILADPSYNKPGPVDLILGADVFSKIILNGVIKGPLESPVAQNTELGWILSGYVKKNTTNDKVLCLVSLTDIESQLRKFWEIEEMSEKPRSPEDTICEEIYEKTYQRLDSGRYMVSIPFKINNFESVPLGESKGKAVARLLQLEKKFEKDKELRKDYADFMNNYLSSGHMKPAKDNTKAMDPSEYYYLPHHPVFKEELNKRKLRVVFDASSKTSTGVSLNDNMYTGPTLQQELHTIMLRWRKHKVAYTADIEKMYRQITLNKSDQNYHRIVWRESPHTLITEYKLTTVTYGTRAAPFLAIRSLQQLAKDDKNKFPKASRIVMNDFYVDDVISGNDTIEEALEEQYQLVHLLQGGGFHLRKWASNNSTFINQIPSEARKIGNTQFDVSNTVKTLGISWNASRDVFEFNVNLEKTKNAPTKRTLLSDASKLFDPLGWLAPIVVQAKIMFQSLWLEGLSWDEPLPKDIAEKWIIYKKELSHINDIKIPRWIRYSKTNRRHELHGFCDASEKAYAAVVYFKTITFDDKVSVTLLCAKTKVAPVRRKISLPRLELCGALLLAQLMTFARKALEINTDQSYAWTDSTIVLAWLRGNPTKWKTFVANRVSEIQAITNPNEWKHVKSEENPADCATRVTPPSQLSKQKLWWEGPKWLSSSTTPVTTHVEIQTTLEQRKTVVHMGTIETKVGLELLSRYSSLTKTTAVVAWCKRFIQNCRKTATERYKGLLQVHELERALTTIIELTQDNEFLDEKRRMKEGKKFSKNSRILSLNPFLDRDNIIRVGGRIQQAELTYNQKHPILLPYKSPLTTLVIDDSHKRTLHGGIRLTLTHIRQSYWIIKGHSAVKQQLRRCVRCHRYKAKFQEQLMGSLPRPRLEITRPFTNSGIDYAGPLDIRMSKGRGNKSYKGYLAIFICLSTKAIHLEVVSDMTAEAFIAAFRRFTGRRGQISNLYSDNGTNFVLADKILQTNTKNHIQKYQDTVFEAVTRAGTKWNFIPPASPHFGGLWEAGVKSVKYHLKRVIGENKLTFEELTTVLIQVEACLNSRPLCPLTDDPDDLDVLTPGHFLIGAPLIAPPIRESAEHTLISRWRMLDKMIKAFWDKWSQEYLTRLQQRPKWAEVKDNLKEGEIVLIKDENLPPSRWPLARIRQVHHGKDGLVRVITLKTKGGSIKRPITKISPLPITDNDLKMENPPLKDESQLINLCSMTSEEESNNQADASVGETANIRKGVRRSMIVNLFTFLCVIALLSNHTSIQAYNIGNPVEVTPFSQQPGIYFEEIGRVNMVTNEWNIISYYDLKDYWKELDGFKKYIRKFESICNITQETSCHNSALEFTHQLKVLEENNDILYGRNGKKDSLLRVRRGLFNIIGNIANSLFGVLDEKYAEKIEKEIDSIHQNENHLINLIKNQTSIADSTLNIMKKNQEIIRNQFEALARHIATISETTNTLDQEIEKQRIATELNSFSTQMILLMVNYQRTQDAILDAVMDTHHGRINALLLTPTQLRNQLAVMRSHLPPTVSIPGDGTTKELQHLYHIMTAKTAVTPRYVLFNIKIPLASTEQFQLFNLIPVPTLHEDRFVFIKPSSDYLVVSLQRDHYYPMSHDELLGCTLYVGTYLCRPRRPIYNIGSNASNCELSFLNHEKTLSADCRLHSTLPSKIWIQLHNQNSWIYVLDNEYTVNVICGGKVYTQKLKGEGILKLNSDCIIKQKTMTIYSPNIQSSQYNSSFIPSIDFQLYLRDKLNSTTSITPEIFVGKNDEIEAVQKSIEELRKRSALPTPANPISSHDVHQYTISYLVIFIILGVAIYMIKRRCDQKLSKSKNHHGTTADVESQNPPTEHQLINDDNNFELQRNTEGGVC